MKQTPIEPEYGEDSCDGPDNENLDSETLHKVIKFVELYYTLQQGGLVSDLSDIVIDELSDNLSCADHESVFGEDEDE